MFEMKTPAAMPLRRNQEVDYWLRMVELVARPANDEGRIRAARTTCRGDAEVIINRPLLAQIATLQECEPPDDQHDLSIALLACLNLNIVNTEK